MIPQSIDSWRFSFHRYRNIWPFEHARVRLQKQKPKQRSSAKLPTSPSSSNPAFLHLLTLPQPTDFLPPVTLSLTSSRSVQLPLSTPAVSSTTDDYVNASYVQPLGTKKRYIATQGPLPETFNDFWLWVITLPYFFNDEPDTESLGLCGNKMYTSLSCLPARLRERLPSVATTGLVRVSDHYSSGQ